MRSARAGDMWKKALKRDAGTIELRSLTTTNVRGIGDLTAVFSSPIMAVCGENGAGKTTLLKTLYAALVPEQATEEGIILRAQDPSAEASASVTVSVLENGAAREMRREVTTRDDLAALRLGEDECPQVVYLDAAGASQRVRYLVQHDQEFSTALEGAPNAPDEEKLLSLRKEITGRHYQTAICYEIDDYSNELVFPYFKVSCGSSSYCSEDMGLGELCINHIIWALERVRNDSIILLEEPESHLPPRAQEALMAYVATRSFEKRLTVIVATHSPHVMARIPNAHVRLLARNGDRFIYTSEPSRNVLYETLRIVPARTAVAIVEDRSAAALLDGILRHCDETLYERIEIGWVNGHSDIDEILERKPNGLTRINILGIYDGDQRQSKGDAGLFLPGDGDPAEYLSEVVKAAPDTFSSMFYDLKPTVEVALAHCAQSDPKNYFLDVRNIIGLDNLEIGSLYRAATKLWLRDGGNLQASKQFVKSLREAAPAHQP